MVVKVAGILGLAKCGVGTLTADKLVLNSSQKYVSDMGGKQYFKSTEVKHGEIRQTTMREASRIVFRTLRARRADAGTDRGHIFGQRGSTSGVYTAR
ncbi:filamentous hemagglutinin [Klebsiella pneumoniae]|uniref:Filamentous hemagglutinin n=1 Tax=Klebsiella pneumoniae TaxID=573 RepID=A0A378BK03_KLEPN|nr:filamentous hemagglutinin [Klebsiella pneumoniae]